MGSLTSSLSGYYLGWLGFRNLGDEAMWDVCRHSIPAVHWTSVSLKQPTHVAEPQDAIGILGGGTLIHGRSDVFWKPYCSLRTTLARPVWTFGTGVEAPTTANQKEQLLLWADSFHKLPYVGVRGPLSKQLLEHSGLSNVVIAGDPAVLLSSGATDRSRSELREKTRLRIAINFGLAGVPMYGEPRGLLQAILRVGRILISKKIDIVIVAVWPPDLEVCKWLSNQLGVNPPRLLTTAQEFVTYIETCDILISFKLHAAILALARQIPTIVLGYADKCEDFLASVALSDLLLRTDRVTEASLQDALSYVLTNYGPLLVRIRQGMAALRNSFEQYLLLMQISLQLDSRLPGSPYRVSDPGKA
jgi:polysaccharide pyruvyl transferase WcaK-like protein